MATSKELRRKSIHKRIRGVVSGTADRPRLSVFRSNKQIYAQLIDDVSGKTLVSASSVSKDFVSENGNKIDQAKFVGKALAEKAVAAGLAKVVFDRSGYLYHGRIKSLAEAARESGLVF